MNSNIKLVKHKKSKEEEGRTQEMRFVPRKKCFMMDLSPCEFSFLFIRSLEDKGEDKRPLAISREE